MLNRWVAGALVALAIGCDSWVETFDLARVERRDFMVVVDSTMTIEQMVAAGEYNDTNPDINTANFAHLRAVTESGRAVLQKVVIFSIGHKVTTPAQVKKLRARLALKPIGIDHQLAFGAQHNRAQRGFTWIVNVDSVVTSNGQLIVPFFFGNLHGDAGYSSLDLRDADGAWPDIPWFFGLSE